MSDFLSGILGRAFGGAGRGGASGMGNALKVAAAALVLQQLTKHFGGGRAGAEAPPPRSGAAQTTGGSVLGDLFGGGAAGGGAGAGTGGLLGGLEGMLGRLRGQGLSQQVDSWVGTGPNAPVAPRELEAAFDPAEVDAIARQAGTDRTSLLDEVSRILPDLVDRMTPGGRVPQDQAELEGREGGGGGGLSGLLASLSGGGEEDRQGMGGATPPAGPLAAPHGGMAVGRGAGGEAGMPRLSDDPPGAAGEGPASGVGGPPLPREGR